MIYGQVIKLFSGRISLLFWILLVMSGNSPAQSVILNPEGEKIVRFEDGSWRYYEARDSIYLENPTLESILAKGKNYRIREGINFDYLLFKKYVAAAVKFESTILDKVDASSILAHSLEDQLNTVGSDAKYLDKRVKLEAELKMITAKRQEEQRILSYARGLIKKILKVGQKSKYRKLAKIYVPGLWEEPKPMTPGQIATNSKIEADKSKKKANSPAERPPSSSVKTEEEPDVDDSLSIDSKEKASAPASSSIDNGNRDLKDDIPEIAAIPGGRWFSDQKAAAPDRGCTFSFHGIDDFTNKQKKELKRELLFTYTDERIKPYLKEGEYVTCNAHLTSISGGFRYLTLTIILTARAARREYGYIRDGSLLNLKLLNGETISLFSQAEEQGSQDPETGQTIYRVRYPIDYQKERSLLKTGIDKMRIVWTSGFEDYDVYNVDFFMKQLECLNSQ